MNSVANGKVYTRTPFKKMYLPAAAGDAGGAIGAAYAVWHSLDTKNPRFQMDHAYWASGSQWRRYREPFKGEGGRDPAQDCAVRRINNSEDLCKTTAAAIGDGKVVGWFEGRMEWGPRGLGNRSILGDPAAQI